MMRTLILSVGLALSTVLLTGCALVGACCAPLAIAVAAAASRTHPDSALAMRDSSVASSHQVSDTRTLTIVVDGLPRRGAFL